MPTAVITAAVASQESSVRVLSITFVLKESIKRY
jgi:hypothetical protein